MKSKVGCCASCIDDRALSQQIFPTMETENGTCKYCDATNTTVVTPIDLRDRFEALLSAYTLDENGKPLADWLKEDWLMFPSMDSANITILLADILDDDGIVRKKFVPKILDDDTGLLDWVSFRTELMYENRFFLTSDLDLDRLATLLSLTSILSEEIESDWFRARIQDGETPLAINDMGAPPERKSTHGRANPAGIPYLYIASNKKTAISETRPQTGETVNAVMFSLQKNLYFVDLRNPRKLVSPFLFDDENDIYSLRRDIPFLEELGEELTKPVLPSSASIDYIPSQYICEYIKKCGFAGVIYKSSVGSGINLALFSSNNASATDPVTQHKVTKVSVETTE